MKIWTPVKRKLLFLLAVFAIPAANAASSDSQLVGRWVIEFVSNGKSYIEVVEITPDLHMTAWNQIGLGTVVSDGNGVYDITFGGQKCKINYVPLADGKMASMLVTGTETCGGLCGKMTRTQYQPFERAAPPVATKPTPDVTYTPSALYD